MRSNGSGDGARMEEIASLAAPDGVYDCAWSERVPTLLATCSGDGSVLLWDYARDCVLREFREHSAEVYSVHWNQVTKEHMLSGAWDNTVKVRRAWGSGTELATFRHVTSIRVVLRVLTN